MAYILLFLIFFLIRIFQLLKKDKIGRSEVFENDNELLTSNVCNIALRHDRSVQRILNM